MGETLLWLTFDRMRNVITQIELTWVIIYKGGILIPSSLFLYIKSGAKKIGHILKCAFNKKSTIFAQSLWNFVKMIIWWGQYFDQVSYKLGKNCGFFNKSSFQHVSDFFCTRLYFSMCNLTMHCMMQTNFVLACKWI